MNQRISIIYFTVLFLLFSLTGFQSCYAQQMKVKNLEKYDNQLMHFGFLLGINNTDFKVTRSSELYKSDSALIVEPDGLTGFNLGIVSDLQLSNNFDLRFVPDLAFSQRNLNYQIINPGKAPIKVIKKIESTFIEFPLEIKFKSNRINNYRIYVSGGFKYMIDLVSQAKVENNQQLVKLKKKDYGYFIGFGIDCYMPLFKFSPEIKMFQGIPNVLQNDQAIYTTSLSSLKSRVFTVSLLFE